MNKIVCDLTEQLDMKDLTIRIAFQCAPVIAGVKVSNLLTVPSKQDSQVKDFLEGTELSCRKLAGDHGRSVFLLYRKKELAFWIIRRSNQALLAHAGLGNLGLERLLDQLAQRYHSYFKDGSPYPHEIGVLLGYPPEDVRGFVVNKGKNCLMCGYWKVYGDPAACRKQFEAFDRAREEILSRISEGISLHSILSAENGGRDDIDAA